MLEVLNSARSRAAATRDGVLVSMNGQTLAPAFTATGGRNTLWYLKTRDVVAPTSNAPVSFAGVGRSNSYDGSVDNIKLTAVPEPATWALMITGRWNGRREAARQRKAPAAVATGAYLSIKCNPIRR